MELKVLLVLLLAVTLVASQNCSEHTECSACTLAGCQFCSGGKEVEGVLCWSIDDDTKECETDDPDNSPAIWILPTEAEKCFGGCESLGNDGGCKACTANPVCRYCLIGGNMGCSSFQTPNDDCTYFGEDSCTIPCQYRESCQQCTGSLDTESCEWCGEKCHIKGAGTGQCLVTADSCPGEPDAASTLSFALLGVLALVLVSSFM